MVDTIPCHEELYSCCPTCLMCRSIRTRSGSRENRRVLDAGLILQEQQSESAEISIEIAVRLNHHNHRTILIHMEVSTVMGVPLYRWMVYFVENPRKMDDDCMTMETTRLNQETRTPRCFWHCNALPDPGVVGCGIS